MKKYNVSKELKQLLVEALKDLNRKIFSDYHRLANEYDIRPQKNPDTGKMEVPNFSLDMTPDEMQQLRQQTIDQGLEPVFTDLGAKDDLDPQDTVKSYEPTVNMRKQDDTDADGTTTLNYDLSKTDVDGFSTTLADAIATAIQDHPKAFKGSEEKVSMALLTVLKSLDGQDLYDRANEGKKTKKEG